jgi:hypothetical protein
MKNFPRNAHPNDIDQDHRPQDHDGAEDGGQVGCFG